MALFGRRTLVKRLSLRDCKKKIPIQNFANFQDNQFPISGHLSTLSIGHATNNGALRRGDEIRIFKICISKLKKFKNSSKLNSTEIESPLEVARKPTRKTKQIVKLFSF